MNDLIQKVQRHLTPAFLKVKPTIDHPLAGHCYVASEALYHLGLKDEGYTPCRGRDEDGVVHWWLVSPEGYIVDPTAAQYLETGRTPPYARGRPGGFLTRGPCRRTQALLANIKLDH